jgi:hypothetical protein
MLFIQVAILALSCGTVLAVPVDATTKSTAVIENSIKNVIASLGNLVLALQSLDRAVKKSEDSALQVADIQYYSEDVVTNLKEGTAQITTIPSLYTYESLSMVSTVQSLTDHVQATTSAWIAAKSSIERTGGKMVAQQILDKQAAASEDFSNAIISKTPIMTMSAAKRYSTKSKSAIQQAIQSFWW